MKTRMLQTIPYVSLQRPPSARCIIASHPNQVIVDRNNTTRPDWDDYLNIRFLLVIVHGVCQRNNMLFINDFNKDRRLCGLRKFHFSQKIALIF